MSLKIQRKWAMPNKETFKIKPIKELLERYVGDGKGWIDPFAGLNSPAEITNDLNPTIEANYNLEAIDFLEQLEGTYPGGLYDPPYSPRQIKECYNGIGMKPKNTNAKFYSEIKDKLSQLISPGAIIISFGWNSTGMGKNRGFKIIEILLVPHGGAHNDTIVIVERKTPLPALEGNK